MTIPGTNRAFVLLAAFALAFSAVSWRLIYIQVEQHEKWAGKAAEKHAYKRTIPARRGMILDRNGVILAQNEPIKTVVVDGTLVRDNQRERLGEILSKHLAISHDQVMEKLGRRTKAPEGGDRPSPYIVIKKEVSEKDAAAIREEVMSASIRGISFEQDYLRVYPNGDMACHLIGFVNRQGQGMDGIERQFEGFLRGFDGVRYSKKDRQGRELLMFRNMERPPRDGATVRLTMDLNIQDIVEDELNAAVKQYRPRTAIAVVMRPDTGEVLALANRPHFNLNQREGVEMENKRNRAIMDMVEPGSTFKLVTAAAALNKGLVTPESYIFCHHGAFPFGGAVLHDHHGYGDLTVKDIIVKSSNIGTAKLGLKVGEQGLYEYVRRFGFGAPSGIALPGEAKGIVHPPDHWSKISITRIPMGHEVGATPLQVINALSTVANGGRMMTPQIVMDVTGEGSEVLSKSEPLVVRDVVPKAVCSKLTTALTEVVSKIGTAEKAHIPGFQVAGKTGTAQRPGKGGYEKGKYVVSFAGFFPAQNPELAILVLLDDAKVASNLNYGGQVAAPIFSRIGARVATYLGLEPQPEFMKVLNPLKPLASAGNPASLASLAASSTERRRP